MFIWVALCDNAKQAKILCKITETRLNLGFISVGAKEKLPCLERFVDMEGHAKKCVERCCELANKTTQQLYKVVTPCFNDHQLKEEELGSVGELSQVCSQIVLKCLYLARIGRPDSHSMVQYTNLHEQSPHGPELVTTRLARLISFIHHTSEFKQYCHVGNTAQQCRLGMFQDSDF